MRDEDLTRILVEIHQVFNKFGIEDVHEVLGILEVFKQNMFMRQINPEALLHTLKRNARTRKK